MKPCVSLRSLLRLAGAFAAGGVAAAELNLPPISGELAGDVALPALPGSPALHWKLALERVGATGRVGQLTVSAPDLLVRARVSLDAATGEGTWRLEEGRLALGPWFKTVSPRLGPTAEALAVQGAITLAGEGGWRQGRPTGKITFALGDGTVKHAAQGWSLDGVSLRGEIDAATLLEGGVPLELAVRTITTTRFGARNLTASLRLNGTREAVVSAAKVEVAGGELSVEPFTVPLDPPSIAVTAKMSRVGLQDIVALVPTGFSDARGRIDGELRLRWNQADGLRLGLGWLKLNASEPTQVTLAPQPGLITGQLQWWNPGRFWAPVYRMLRRIELGQAPLTVDVFSVEISPEGDDRNRTSRVRVRAATSGEGLRVPLEIDVAVAGPLDQLLKLGMNDRVKLNGK